MKKITIITAIAILVSVSTPTFATTAVSSSPEMMLLMGRGDFCTTIKTIDIASISLPFGKALPDVEQKKQGLLNKIAEKFRRKSKDRPLEVTDSIEARAATIAEKSADLRKLVNTTTEKSAVEQFIKSVAAAEAAKKAMVDPLYKKYRSDMEALVTSKSGVSAEKIASAKVVLASAIKTANDNCTSGTKSAVAKEMFTKSIESTISQFRDFRPNAELRQEIKLLDRKNRYAVHAIEDAFRDSMDEARDILEISLPAAAWNDKHGDRSGYRKDDSNSGNDARNDNLYRNDQRDSNRRN